MIVAEKEPQVLIFDFSRVKGIDSSAAATFAKIVIFLNGADIEIIATGGGANVREMLLDVEINSRFSDAFMPVDYSLDEALEHWEDQLLMSSKVDVSATFSITNWMGSALGSDEYAKALTQALTRRDIAAGEYICRQGDSTDALLFIESGRVSVLLEELDTPIRRLRVFGPRTIVGEIGFFFNQKRTATLRSDKPTTIWALDHQAFVHLRDTQPAITSSLLIYIIAQQSERLTYTSRQIAALSR
jgi:SulP family sulfate permease